MGSFKTKKEDRCIVELIFAKSPSPFPSFSLLALALRVEIIFEQALLNSISLSSLRVYFIVLA
jgi:hypothetical protein